MIRVLILLILTALASASQSSSCQNVSYLENSEAVMAYKMKNKNATLYALCRVLIDHGLRTPKDAEAALTEAKIDILNTYNNYNVSKIRQNTRSARRPSLFTFACLPVSVFMQMYHLNLIFFLLS